MSFNSWYYCKSGRFIACGPEKQGSSDFEELCQFDSSRGLRIDFNNETRVETRWLMQFHADELRKRLNVPLTVVIKLDYPFGDNTRVIK